GKAVLVVSVELDEIRSLSDRILVMSEQTIVGEHRNADIDLERLLAEVAGRPLHSAA
ncbi:MAG: sugar ABC transporter ATP-binding protein, partial [Mesorhizobium sp.]